MDDEQQIRDLIQTWMTAIKDGDIETVLDLMTDDVVFMVVGQKPFGKEAFQSSAQAMRNGPSSVHYEGENNVEELKVLGDWAYVRARLKVTTIPSDGSAPSHRAGYTLSIFRKEPDGKWRLARDANLLEVVE